MNVKHVLLNYIELKRPKNIYAGRILYLEQKQKITFFRDNISPTAIIVVNEFQWEKIEKGTRELTLEKQLFISIISIMKKDTNICKLIICFMLSCISLVTFIFINLYFLGKWIVMKILVNMGKQLIGVNLSFVKNLNLIKY